MNSPFFIHSFIVEEWGDCSSPCGEGIRERKVECKMFLEFSKTVAVLPDHECPGPKPPLTEICFSGLCQAGVNGQLLPPVMQPLTFEVNNVQKDDQGVVPHRLQMDIAIPDASVYKWKDMGFTTCSESCLGGLQESKIICVDRDGDAVSPMHCAEMERPDMMVRTCNDHPCPPRYLILIQYRLFFVRRTHSCINYFRKFTQIVLKFKTCKTCVNLFKSDKISCCILV